MKIFMFLLGLCVIAVGVLLALMTPFAYKAGDKFGTVVVGCLAGVALLFGRRLMRRSPESWRDGPATDKQKSFADSLGIQYPKGISKGDLSDLISAETGR